MLGIDPIDEIRSAIKRAESFAVAWHGNVQKWRDLYDFKHYGGMPKAKSGESRYSDPTYTNTVDLAVGMLLANEIIWRARGWKPSPNEEGNASSLEKFIAGVIDANKDRKEIDVKYETTLNFVRDGGGVLLGVWDKALHDKAIETDLTDAQTGESRKVKLYQEMPLRVEVVDPLKMLFYPGGLKRWKCIARRERMNVYDVEHTYDIQIKKYEGKTESEKLDIMGDLVDYWDFAFEVLPPEEVSALEEISPKILSASTKQLVVRNGILFDNDFVKDIHTMPGYEDLPYTMSFFKPSSSEDSGKWHSIISPMENPVKELEELTNMRKRLILVYSSLPMFVRSREGRPVVVDKALGKIIPLKQDEDVGFPQWQGTPPDFDKQMEMYRSRIQQSGFSDIMFGSGTDNVSGYAATQLGDQNRIRLETPVAHLEDLWTWSARKWLSMVENFAPDAFFQVYGHIRGDDFAELVAAEDIIDLNIRCEIKPEFPSERVRNHSMATQVAGFLDAETIIEEYLGQQQPDEIREKRLSQMMEEHPAYMQYAIMKKLKEASDAGDTVAGMALQALVQGIQGQGGRPTEPNNPEQLMGVQSPTGGTVPSNQIQSGQEGMIQAQNQSNASPRMDGSIGGQ